MGLQPGADRRRRSGRCALLPGLGEAETRIMDWQTTYRMAAERHRSKAASARGANLLYQAALHERAVELLEAEARRPEQIRAPAPGSETRFSSYWIARKALQGYAAT